MKFNFQVYMAGVGLMLALFLSGCAAFERPTADSSLGHTKITVPAWLLGKDGPQAATIDSNKNHNILYEEYGSDGKIQKRVKIQAVTPENMFPGLFEAQQQATSEQVGLVRDSIGLAKDAMAMGANFAAPGAGTAAKAAADALKAKQTPAPTPAQ
jgi:hypothetical protein